MIIIPLLLIVGVFFQVSIDQIQKFIAEFFSMEKVVSCRTQRSLLFVCFVRLATCTVGWINGFLWIHYCTLQRLKIVNNHGE